jgi:hypothetical protein
VEYDREWCNRILNILEERTSVNSETGCWEWTGAKNKYGYGVVRIDYVLWTVHRLSAIVFHGYRPEYKHLHILHNPECKVKHCWGRDHIRVGTHQENMQDVVDAGTGRNQNSEVTHCKNGHEFTSENTYLVEHHNDGKMHRHCRECQKAAKQRYLLKFGKVG